MAIANKFDAACFKCGRMTAKGKGFVEKTNQSHRRLCIQADWVTRCHKCKGCQFNSGKANNVSKMLLSILPAPFTTLAFNVWFDTKGMANIIFTLYKQDDSRLQGALFNQTLPTNMAEVKSLFQRMISYSN